MKWFISVVSLAAFFISACSAVPTDKVAAVPLDTPKSASDAVAPDATEKKTPPVNNDDADIPDAVTNPGKQDTMPIIPPLDTALNDHDNREQTAEDKSFITENIRGDITTQEITDNSNMVDTASGDADAGAILSGRIAWVDGQEISGILEVTSCADMPNCSGTKGSCVFSYDDCARETQVFGNWDAVVDGLRYYKNGAPMTYGWCSGRAECCRSIK